MLHLGVQGDADTPPLRMPGHADVSSMDASYDVSEHLSRSTDLQRIC
jgi:hypothetical protein